MAWTNPVTWVDGQLVAAADLNAQIRDNLNYLLTPNVAHQNTALGNLSTTSTTYASLGTAWALALNSYGGYLNVGMQGFFAANFIGAANDVTALIAIDIDGTPYLAATVRSNDNGHKAATRLFTGIPSGAHVVTLKWKVAGNVPGTASMLPAAEETDFWVVEL